MAHRWLADGQQEQDLMRLPGGRSRQMIGRYTASAADERTLDAHRRAGLGDRPVGATSGSQLEDSVHRPLLVLPRASQFLARVSCMDGIPSWQEKSWSLN
jgi:hypothetical protein